MWTVILKRLTVKNYYKYYEFRPLKKNRKFQGGGGYIRPFLDGNSNEMGGGV